MSRRSGLALALALALAGCGSDSGPAARTRAARATATTAASTAGPACCDGVRAHAIRFPTSDGLDLSGAVVGSGPVGAVLIHEYPLDLCGWWAVCPLPAEGGARKQRR